MIQLYSEKTAIDLRANETVLYSVYLFSWTLLKLSKVSKDRVHMIMERLPASPPSGEQNKILDGWEDDSSGKRSGSTIEIS